MKCPYCSTADTRVIDTRETTEAIRRRRECVNGHRFTTYERVARATLSVIKRDSRREDFDLDKLTAGMLKATANGPVPPEKVEEVARAIQEELLDMGRPEVESAIIGNLVMRRLRELDELAYVRFASVYRRFRDLDSLAQEIQDFKEWKRREEELEHQLKLTL